MKTDSICSSKRKTIRDDETNDDVSECVCALQGCADNYRQVPCDIIEYRDSLTGPAVNDPVPLASNWLLRVRKVLDDPQMR